MGYQWSLAPNVPLATAEVIIATSTGMAPTGTSGLSTDELIKSMEEMKLQVSELQKVKEQFVTLEQKYDLPKIDFVEKVRENKGLAQQVKSLEKDLTFDKPLADIRKILWTNITQSINDVCPSIQIIFEQIDLLKVSLEEIHKTKEELGRMHEEATRLINFLNSKNKYQLEELGIEDKTGTILEVKKVLTKRSLMQNLERRC